MRFALAILFAVTLSTFAADVISAPVIAVDTTVSPPTVTITIVLDGTNALAAQKQAVSQAIATGQDPVAAGRTAFVLVLTRVMGQLVENARQGATQTDAQITADVAAQKAQIDAAAAAALKLRPQINVK